MSNKKLIIIIHIINDNITDIKLRTLTQVKIAFDNLADGVILTIGEGGLDVETLLLCYNYVRATYKTKFIGINFMSDFEIAAKLIPLDANALWIDKGLGQTNYINELIKIKSILKSRQWNGLYFGSLCLKGNNQILFDSPEKLKLQNWEPEKYFDVCVTSGISTGISINVDILEIIKNKANGLPIALASGINILNIESFIPYTDYFLIGTSVEKTASDKSLIDFYREANLPDPVIIGSLDSEKICNIANKLKSILLLSK